MTERSHSPATDLSITRRIHVIGVGGSGMSAIAEVLVAMGHDVSGSDARHSPVLDRAAGAGVHVQVGHFAGNLAPNVEVVAVSTAIPPDNPEVTEAHRRGLPVLNRSALLPAIAATRRTVAVGGTHGKTTTSTLLALVLEGGGLRPSWIIGGEILGRGNGAKWDTGPWFVIEADESDGTFTALGAEAVVITNVEPDHLAHYGGWDGLEAAFDSFVSQAPGPRVACLDDPGAAELAHRWGAVTYGVAAEADYRITDVQLGRFDARFRLKHVSDLGAVVHLPAPGMHNVRNAAAAIVMGHQLGVSLKVGAAALGLYQGVGRRFQLRGEVNGITLVDDYAHLPSEVSAALSAARAGEWGRIVAVFQPHRYSRTEEVGADFGGAFDNADVVVLADVYGAGEAPRPGVSGEIVRRAVEEVAGHPPVTYVADRQLLAADVAGLLQPGDLCLTLGAGDVTGLADELLAIL